MTTDKTVKIKYRRKSFSVPKWARWVATDEDGSIFVFRDKPVFEEGVWDSETGPCKYIGDRLAVKAPGNTLEEIKMTKPHFVMVKPGDVAFGDVITAPSKLYADGWFPLMRVSCFTNYLGGEIENGPKGTGARTYWITRDRDYVFKKVSP